MFFLLNHIKTTYLGRGLFFIVSLSISGLSCAFSLPDNQTIFPNYSALSSPTLNSDPALAKPIAIISSTKDGSATTIKIQLDTIGAEADIYFGMSASATEPGILLLLNENDKVVVASENLTPWKRSVTNVNEELIFEIPFTNYVSGPSTFTYTFYLLLTAPGLEQPLATDFYLWSTTLKVSNETTGSYIAPEPYGSYPATQETVQGWIDTLDTAAIRAHSWDIWASITAPSDVDNLPTWETWFSGHEIFDLTPKVSLGPLRDIEQPKQFHHTQLLAGLDTPVVLPESLTSFNRYTKTLADSIIDHQFNELSTLQAINNQFNAEGTAVIDRKILTSDKPVDSSQIVLKPVFQFISATEPTVIPYWAGASPSYTTNLNNPEPKTWRQGVVVDPTGKLQPGTSVMMAVNNESPKLLAVVSLDDFYSFILTEAEADAFFESFGFGSGDDIGADNDTAEEALREAVKAGNYALLMAMHITTKEIPNWTWQTIWWAGNPQDILFGKDRPASIPSPWNHYNMRTAYYMVSPTNTAGGEPLISYNPYLETNLQGTVPGPNGSNIDWTGVHSNCMSCHRMAGYKTQGYQPSGLILADDPALFGKGTKTDFLWSIPIRAFASK